MFISEFSNKTNLFIHNLHQSRNLQSISHPAYAPLRKDTVSFTGGGKLNGAHMTFAPNEYLCNQVEQNAEPARYYLQKVLDKYIGDCFETKHDSLPPVTYTARIKRANSIREKVISAFMRDYCGDVNVLSVQILNQLLNYYKINDGNDEDDAFDVIKSVIVSLNQTNEKESPYNYVDYYVSAAAENLKNTGIMNIKEFSLPAQNLVNGIVTESINESPEAENSLNKPYIKPSTVAGVKHYANDIVGARFILNDCSTKYTSKLFDGLMQAVKDNKLKITSIENNLPDPDKLPETKRANDYAYAKNSVLKKLAEASGAEFTVNKSKSGYISVHINVDLSNDLLNGYGGVYNGYSGEIQILGADVERLKEVEDLCYKFKDDKSSVSDIYEPFKKVFKTYYTPETKKAFNDYTYALYLHQREIEPGMSQGYSEFPSAERLGFADSIPDELDFNNLKLIKQQCDKEAERVAREKELAADREITPQNAKRQIKKQGDIKTLKSLISFDLK